MDKQKWSLMGSAGVGAGLGAGLMYLLDPQGGRRRRALARDKTVSALKTGGNAALKTGKDLGNRTKGLVHDAGSLLHRGGEVDDQVLCDRVRSKLGRIASHPADIEVTALEGRVKLLGSVPVSEADKLLATVAKVKGVKDVDCQLQFLESDDASLQLHQGNGSSRSRLARAWKPATLILAGTGGAALAVAGFKRRDKVGAALGAAGLGILANSFTRGRGHGLGGDGSVGLQSSQPSSHSGGLKLDDLDRTSNLEAPVEDPGLRSALSEDRELLTTLP